MKTIKRLMLLYPVSWRHRYEDEFIAMLEQRSISLVDTFDIVFGAIDAHFQRIRPNKDTLKINNTIMIEEMDRGVNNQMEKFIPGEVREEASETIIAERRLFNWLDDAFSELQKNGGLDHIEGKGKPLDPQLGKDPLNGILQNAKVLPPWLELQHEIRDSIQQLLSVPPEQKNIDLPTEIARINQMIAKFNKMCPSTLLQKPLLSAANISEQYKRWL